MIFPAGGKRYEWVPSAEGDKKIGVEAMGDDELRGFVPDEAEEFVVEEVPGDAVVEVAIEGDIEGECEDGPCEDLADVSEEGTLEGKVADVVEQLEDVVEEVKEVAEMAGIEIGEDLGEELGEELGEGDVEEIAEVIEGELEAVTPGEVEEVEEEEFCSEATGVAAAADTKVVVAGEDRAFVKIASLTPENRKQIRTYWVDVLGYDAEYVDAMVQDYEKK